MPTYPNILSSIKIKRQATPDTESDRNDVQSHYIEITAEPDNDGDDPAVFVHRLDVQNVADMPPLESASFERVCSPADYNELPVGPPGSDDSHVEFRLDTIKHFARSTEEIEALYDYAVQDVNQLLDAFSRAEELLGDEETVTLDGD